MRGRRGLPPWAFLLLLACGSGCALGRPLPEPVLEPGPHMPTVGPEAAADDIRHCRQQVYDAAPVSFLPIQLPPLGAVGPSTNGVVIGTVGPPHRRWESEATYRQAVGHCLGERGYRIKGWR